MTVNMGVFRATDCGMEELFELFPEAGAGRRGCSPEKGSGPALLQSEMIVELYSGRRRPGPAES